MSFDVLKLLHDEGYVKYGPDNMIHAEKAFFGARVMNWIRYKVKTEPGFDLASYLTMLLYYKTDVADLKFSEDGDKIMYRMRKDNDKEIQNLVDQLLDTSKKIPNNSSSAEGKEPEPTDVSGEDPNT